MLHSSDHILLSLDLLISPIVKDTLHSALLLPVSFCVFWLEVVSWMIVGWTCVPRAIFGAGSVIIIVCLIGKIVPPVGNRLRRGWFQYLVVSNSPSVLRLEFGDIVACIPRTELQLIIAVADHYICSNYLNIKSKQRKSKKYVSLYMKKYSNWTKNTRKIHSKPIIITLNLFVYLYLSKFIFITSNNTQKWISLHFSIVIVSSNHRKTAIIDEAYPCCRSSAKNENKIRSNR